MPISESQLQTWSRYVESPQSQRTADLIRDELKRVGTEVVARDYEVYLQGSYRNHTNIFRDSDVDVVVELSQIFYSGVSQLPPGEEQLRKQAYSPGTITLQQFRDQVLRQLRRRFSGLVEDGDKAIKVGGTGERLNADVLVCAEYRQWKRFRSVSDNLYVPGVTFWTQDDHRQVINFPKVHWQNGVNKQKSSREWFKPTVRTVKNARRLLYDRELLPRGSAPSYFIQCFLYNVPDAQFGITHQQNFEDVLKWLEGANLSTFVCQNEQTLLFGPTPEQWNLNEAKALIRGLRYLWSSGV